MHSYRNFVKGSHSLGVVPSTSIQSAQDRQSSGNINGEQAQSSYEEIVGLKKSQEQFSKRTEKDDSSRKHKEKKQQKNCNQRMQALVHRKDLGVETGRQEQFVTLDKVSQSRTSQSCVLDKSQRVNNKYLLCAQEGDIDGLQSHLKSSFIDINVADVYGWTALMCASHGGHAGIVQHLLECGADASHTDGRGRNAADLAKTSTISELFRRHRNGLALTKDPGTTSTQPFYCEICKTEFSDTTVGVHETSTIHLFNCQFQPKPTHYFLPTNNRGFQMMLRSGWQPDKGLGSEGQGQKFPVKTLLKRDRQGIGSEKVIKPRVTHFGPKDTAAVETIMNPVRTMRASTLSKKAQKRKLSKEKKKARDFRLEFYAE